MSLEIRNICKSFGEKKVLEDISFTVEEGTAFGFLGRNGAGKTTTIRIIMDVFGPDAGEILIDGKPVKNTTKKIGYLPEERGLYPKRVISEQMAYFGELRGMSRSEAKTASKKLLDKLDAGEYYQKKLDTLSKGNQQKIQLAIALLNDPDIIILDEPFSGLDPINAKILKDLVAETVQRGKTVLFSSHQMASVEEFCEDLCIINKGEIVLEGNLNQIKKTYPRNRILLKPEDGAEQIFKTFFECVEVTELITGFEKNKDNWIVSLKVPENKAKFLKLMSEKTPLTLDTFTVVEPTLEDIFVEKAGEDDA